jgi:hypothetical protein
MSAESMGSHICEGCCHVYRDCTEAGCVAESVLGNVNPEQRIIVAQMHTADWRDTGYFHRIFRTAIAAYDEETGYSAVYTDGSVLTIPFEDDVLPCQS